MRDLVVLMLVAAASAAFVASSYVGLTIAAGLLTAKDFLSAALRYWIGDVVGILVLAPFALFALTRRRIMPMSIETALQYAAVVCALTLVFGIAEEREFQLFYVLFLPIVWMAVRNGIEGVSAGILVTQLGVILGARFFPNEREELIAFQALMLVLAVTGLIAGELVTERRRMESQLRLHQELLARLTRLGSIGELAAAVAHEVNQPLMAAGTYTRLVADMTSSRNAERRRSRGHRKEGGGADRSRSRGDPASSRVGATRSEQSRAVPFRATCQGGDRTVPARPRSGKCGGAIPPGGQPSARDGGYAADRAGAGQSDAQRD